MEKITKLKEFIKQYKSIVIAFSGGVDSTFLARVSKDVLNNNILLVTATSHTYPYYELEDAKKLAALLALEHMIIVSEEIDIPGFSDNPPDRCFYCKRELFRKIKHIATRKKYDVVFDGSNADDVNDYRPGMKAIMKAGVISPLKETGFSKEEIRLGSKQYNLPTADKPAYACLASRFPYGEKISIAKLERVEKTEFNIRQMGFSQFRVRSHDNLARLEFVPTEMDKAWNLRDKLNSVCIEAGYNFVTIDLKGYRTGAMNKALKINE